MKIAVLVTILSVAGSGCGWASLGETRQEIEARYGHPAVDPIHNSEAKSLGEKPLEFRTPHGIILVWLKDGRSVAEMSLWAHSLNERQIGHLLSRQAGSAGWSERPVNHDKARLWARKDNKALAWVIDPDSGHAVFVAVEKLHLRQLAACCSFRTVAQNCPEVWAGALKLAGKELPTGSHAAVPSKQE